ESGKHVFCKKRLARLANGVDAGTNSATGFGNLFVGSTGDALLEIHQSRLHEHWMGVRIDEAGKNDLALTIDLLDALAVFLEPRVADRVLCFPDGNDLPAHAEHGGIFNDGKVAEVVAAAGPGSL